MTLRRFVTGAKREDGAVLPLVALLILVLFGFAALGVDASAAYAERRQAQSAADAAVMAAALQYLAPTPPSGNDLYDLVKTYVNNNWTGDHATTDSDWAACSDPNKPATYAPVQDTSVTPAVVISDCLSIKQVDGEPALLRVRLPNFDMQTAFASVIGWNSLAISATATAELRYKENTKVLPFSLPTNPADEECLATPPSGLLPGDQSPCSGPVQGNFGVIDSPWFGAGDPHFTDTTTCPGGNFAYRSPHNMAIGLDHIITTHPNPQPAVGVQQPNNPPGGDICASAAAGVVPYILNTQAGNTQSPGGQALLQAGFIGDDPSPLAAATLPGRLRQMTYKAVPPAGPNNRFLFDTTSWDFTIDNVGLWEFNTSTAGNPGSNPCHTSNFRSSGKVGRELTDQMWACMSSNSFSPSFSIDLLESPRFAVVPVLNYNSGSQFGNKWWAVLEMRPVYLHSTWYDCTNTTDPECLFQPEDFVNDPSWDPSDRDKYSVLHNPGEGSASPCYLNAAGACVIPSTDRFQLMGLSAIILTWDMLPPNAENQYGGSAPFQVFLHDNE